MVKQAADRVTDVILRSTRYEMLHNDRDALYNIIQELGSEPGIQRIRIFNKDGRITLSTDAREVDTGGGQERRGLLRCHAQSAPLTKLNRPDRARRSPTSRAHLLAVIRPIDNAPECSDAACHVHPAGQQVLG
jgi:hypothetical protein